MKEQAALSNVNPEHSDHSIEVGSNLTQPSNPYSNIENGDVCYPREVKMDAPVSTLNETDKNQTLEFTKLVLESYMNNILKINGYIICSVPLLEHMIEVLTGCDNCEILTNDPEMNCCGQEVKLACVGISKIWVTVNGSKTIFKYQYAQYLELFEKYRISLKLVSVQQ